MARRARLDNQHVIVTRPIAQAESLCRLLLRAGAVPLKFPTLAIEVIDDVAAGRQIKDTVRRCHIAIFVSANAVAHAEHLLPRPIPPAMELAVIGKASARALAAVGLTASIAPRHGFDSEALLAHPKLADVGGKRIVIFRGKGGRGLLASALRERGAVVDYVEVYRRILPTANPGPLLEAWRAGRVFAATATSNETLGNLFQLVGPPGVAYLCQTPLVVLSERARKRAIELGVRAPVVIASEPSDRAVVEALTELAISN